MQKKTELYWSKIIGENKRPENTTHHVKKMVIMFILCLDMILAIKKASSFIFCSTANCKKNERMLLHA
jgi:cytochrome c oxidase assembly factor CtaG